MKKNYFFTAVALGLMLAACSKNDNSPQSEGPKLIFKFKFDSTQVRLNNLGEPASISAGHSAQSPKFNKMSAHYIELAPGALTQLGQGVVLYHAPEVGSGLEQAIDFEQSKLAGNGEEFFSIPLREVKSGTYEWLRISLAYQNYDIKFKFKYPVDPTQVKTADGTIASFIGFNTYIKTVQIKNTSLTVNANKKQGFWAFEALGTNLSGDSQGTTTVPNPLSATSPIKPGSCVVTGKFSSQNLTITGNETKDIVIEVSLSTNKSFEWIDQNQDGWFQPDDGDQVVDMGVRGLIPTVKQ